MAFLVQRACGPIIQFSSLSHASGLTLTSFVQQTKGHSADSFPFLSPTILTVLMPVDSNKGVRVLTSSFLSL